MVKLKPEKKPMGSMGNAADCTRWNVGLTKIIVFDSESPLGHILYSYRMCSNGFIANDEHDLVLFIQII